MASVFCLYVICLLYSAASAKNSHVGASQHLNCRIKLKFVYGSYCDGGFQIFAQGCSIMYSLNQ